MESHKLLCMYIIIMLNGFYKMLRIGGRSYTTGTISVVQRVVARVMRFHHLFAGKSKWEIHVGNELRDMHHQYMDLWCFLYNENFHYFPEGALKFGIISACLELSMSPNIPLSTSWGQRKQWRIGSALGLAVGCLDNRWLDSMVLPSSESCSNSKCRTCNSMK